LVKAIHHIIILEINKRQKAHEMEVALESKTRIEAEDMQRSITVNARSV